MVHLKGEGTVLVQALTPNALTPFTARGVATAFVDTQEGEWKQTESGVWQEGEEALAGRHRARQVSATLSSSACYAVKACLTASRETSAFNVLVHHGHVEYGSCVQVRNAGDERLKDNGTVLATTWPSSPCSSLAKMPSSVSS